MTEPHTERLLRDKRRWWIGALSAAAACAVAVVWLRTPALRDGMTEHGGEERLFSVRCAAGAVCHSSEKLLIGASATTALPYFAAFLEANDGQTRWIVPNEEKDTATTLGTSFVWLPQALQLDTKIPSGDATVYGIFLPQRFSQKEIAERFEHRRAKVIERHITVVVP
jgi:hypothetical protein